MMKRKDVMGQFKKMVIDEMDRTNCEMDTAIKAIEALRSNNKVIKRWNKTCIAHSEQMNASALHRLLDMRRLLFRSSILTQNLT